MYVSCVYRLCFAMNCVNCKQQSSDHSETPFEYMGMYLGSVQLHYTCTLFIYLLCETVSQHATCQQGMN